MVCIIKLNIQMFAKKITTTITETAIGDATSNTSNVKVKAYFESGSSETYFNSKTLKIYLQRIEPNGNKTQVGSWSGSVSLSKGGSVSKEVTFKTISHQQDGSLKVRAYFYIATGTSGLGTITESDTDVTKTLTTIPRASDFQHFDIRINSNSSITVNVTINKKHNSFIDELTFCNQTVTVQNGSNSITFSKGSTAYKDFYKIMGNNFTETYSAGLQTLDSTGTKTIGTVSILNATASLNNIDNVEGRTYGLQVTYMNVNDDNGNNYIASTNANGTTYTSTHKVSEFTTSNTFLQNWSNPNFSYAVEAFTTLPNTATNYTFGNLISLYFNTPLPMPKIELTGAAYTGNTGGIGTNFSEAIYKIQGSDGRVLVSAPLLSIHKKAWEKPTVNLTLTRQSSTSNKVDWTLSYSYTYVARNNGNLTPTIYASYTYNGVETQLVSQNLSQTSGTLSGTITLRNADDYKYPISAVASITDMIDYKVHSKINIPSGQPAIYCHKDSNSNNVVDIYGAGVITPSANQYSGLVIKSSNYNEASITYTKSSDTSKSWVAGYGTAGFDGFGIYSHETAQNILTINKDGQLNLADDTSWTQLTMESGFQQVSWNPLKVKRKCGIVQIIGMFEITSMTSWIKPIAYLPSGFKPDNEINVVCRNANGGLAIIAITSQGIFWLNQDGVGDISSGTIVLTATYIGES